MTIKYRKAYLTDGTQVKITEDLFNLLREWEKEGLTFHYSYIDLLKTQDNEMINQQRKYYSHNVSLEEELNKKFTNQKLMRDRSNSTGSVVKSIVLRNALHMVLDQCTESQRRRFIKYYYLDFTLEKVAGQEGCSISSVYRSIKKVEKKLIDFKKFF